MQSLLAIKNLDLAKLGPVLSVIAYPQFNRNDLLLSPPAFLPYFCPLDSFSHSSYSSQEAPDPSWSLLLFTLFPLIS